MLRTLRGEAGEEVRLQMRSRGGHAQIGGFYCKYYQTQVINTPAPPALQVLSGGNHTISQPSAVLRQVLWILWHILSIMSGRTLRVRSS